MSVFLSALGLDFLLTLRLIGARKQRPAGPEIGGKARLK